MSEKKYYLFEETKRGKINHWAWNTEQERDKQYAIWMKKENKTYFTRQYWKEEF
jgi:hypothetical protein